MPVCSHFTQYDKQVNENLTLAILDNILPFIVE